MYKKVRCASCIYRGQIAAGGGVYCDYLSIMNQRRPCSCSPGGEDCTVYKPAEKAVNRRRALSLRMGG